MKMISRSKSGNLKNVQSQVYMWEVKVGMYFLGGFGGTIGKYLRAKQSLDSSTNSL